MGDLLLIALLTIVVLVIVRFLYKYIMNRLYQKVSDDELLESKSVDDFIKLFIEHKVKGEYGDAVRYLFLAFVKTVMAKGYKYSSNYQLFLHSQKLFPNHKSELREFIKLFEDTRYGNRVCSDEDLNFAQVSFEKFTEQYRFTSTSNSSVVGASQ